MGRKNPISFVIYSVGALVLSIALLQPQLKVMAFQYNPEIQEKLQDSQTETYPGTCDPWTQVNQSGFGLPGSTRSSAGSPFFTPVTAPRTPFAGEEGFDALVFNQRLYLGMEANNNLGARLWRTKAVAYIPDLPGNWEEVAADSQGYPFGQPDIAQNDHVDSLAEFRNYIFVSTANRSEYRRGARLFRSASGDPDTWEDAQLINGPGFGDINNENFKSMIEYQGQLCGGTWNETTGAQFWCSPDGTHWSQKNINGFGNSRNTIIWSSQVFQGRLYIGVQNFGIDSKDNRDDVAKVFRAERLDLPADWEEVFTSPAGGGSAALLGELNGHIYISISSHNGIEVWRSEAGDARSWQPASQAGINGDSSNLGVITDGAVIYNQALYLGVANLKTGFQLWRTTGDLSRGSKVVDWQQVEIDEPNHYQNAYVVLVQFNGSLYAWTTNYFTGQQVLRTHCPVCQQINIQGPGRYQAGGLGVRVDLERTSARSMEVCSYPDSFYLTQLEGRPTKHYYMIRTDPLVSSSSGELSLTYSEAELAASTITGPQPAVLLHRQGQTWETCQTEATERVPEENRVSCSRWDDLNQLWTIGGPGVTPIKGQPGLQNGQPVLLAVVILFLLVSLRALKRGYGMPF